MAKSKRNLSRKWKQSRKRTTGKKRIVRLIRKFIGGTKIESLKAIYDPEWNLTRENETKMEKAFYDKQNLLGNTSFKNVLLVGDENKGYNFADLSNAREGETPNNYSDFLSDSQKERRNKAGISTELTLTYIEIQHLYNFLQNQIHHLYNDALKKGEKGNKEEADNRI